MRVATSDSSFVARLGDASAFLAIELSVASQSTLGQCLRGSQSCVACSRSLSPLADSATPFRSRLAAAAPCSLDGSDVRIAPAQCVHRTLDFSTKEGHSVSIDASASLSSQAALSSPCSLLCCGRQCFHASGAMRDLKFVRAFAAAAKALVQPALASSFIPATASTPFPSRRSNSAHGVASSSSFKNSITRETARAP